MTALPRPPLKFGENNSKKTPLCRGWSTARRWLPRRRGKGSWRLCENWVINPTRWPPEEIEYFEVLRQKQVDGLIYHSGTVTSRHLEVFERLNLPVVLAATHDDGYRFPCVLVDNRRAAEEAMDHLIDLGHRRLGVITGNDPISGKTRLAGYRDALKKHGLKLPEEWTAVLDWRFESAYTAAQRMFNGKRRPTAVAVASDYMALGVVAAAIDPQAAMFGGYRGHDCGAHGFVSGCTGRVGKLGLPLRLAA